MTDEFILPHTQLHLSQTTMMKLRRTELGRSLIQSDMAIADLVKFDPDDADRIWIGVRRSAIKPYAMRTLLCSIDDETYEVLEDAMTTKSVYTLAAFAQRLYDCFQRHLNQCTFIQEPKE